MKIVFPFIAQSHQVMHALPIAAEIASAYPEIEVHVCGATPQQTDEIRTLAQRHAPAAPLHFRALSTGRFARSRPWAGYLWKLAVLFHNRRFLNGFDAMVTPERTSLQARRVGITHPRLVWTRHGAGDRAVGFEQDVAQFDFVCVAGRKIEQRLLADRLIRPGHYVTGIYAKFDWNLLTETPWSPFSNGRPTVLYTPHFRPHLSSWPRFGTAVLDWFAAHPEFNLIFAPHVRLFDPPTPAKLAAFDRWRDAPNIVVDLGSERSIDMSYVAAADVYLGDVSSQVAEFVVRPRPCVFLDAHDTAWQGNADYAFWSLGPVIDSVDALGETLPTAIAMHDVFRERQLAYAAETFELAGERTAPIAAQAIVAYLKTVGA